MVDDATHEAVAIVPERALGGTQLVRILNRLRLTRGLPKAVRTDNGKERPKRLLGGLTPAAYAKKFILRSVKLTPDSKAGCYINSLTQNRRVAWLLN